jgi:hypothetical protein
MSTEQSSTPVQTPEATNATNATEAKVASTLKKTIDSAVAIARDDGTKKAVTQSAVSGLGAFLGAAAAALLF